MCVCAHVCSFIRKYYVSSLISHTHTHIHTHTYTHTHTHTHAKGRLFLSLFGMEQPTLRVPNTSRPGLWCVKKFQSYAPLYRSLPLIQTLCNQLRTQKLAYKRTHANAHTGFFQSRRRKPFQMFTDNAHTHSDKGTHTGKDEKKRASVYVYPPALDVCPSTGRSAQRTARIVDAVLRRFYRARDDHFWTRPHTWSN